MAMNPNGWFRTLVGATTLWCAANASVHAEMGFGDVGGPIDLSANVSEAIVPGGTVFQNSSPLFGTEPDRKESAELHAKRSGPFELADWDRFPISEAKSVCGPLTGQQKLKGQSEGVGALTGGQER
jgi:hypothetical protein